MLGRVGGPGAVARSCDGGAGSVEAFNEVADECAAVGFDGRYASGGEKLQAAHWSLNPASYSMVEA